MPDFPERHILVFDDEKTRADFLEVSETGALSPPPGAGIGEVASLLPDWLVGGGLLVTFAAIDEDSPDSEGEVAGGEPTEPGPESGANAEQEGVFNLIISYDKTSAGQFNALMTFASARLVFVYSGRCTPELDEDLRSQAEPCRDRLAPGSGAE